MLLVPLGDLFERRRLIVLMTLLSAGGLLISSFAHNIVLLLLGTALTGMLSVVAQILVPFVATLAAPHERGKAVGTVMSGLLLGILLARTVAGALADVGSWRTVYWVAALLMLGMSAALWRVPQSPPGRRPGSRQVSAAAAHLPHGPSVPTASRPRPRRTTAAGSAAPTA